MSNKCKKHTTCLHFRDIYHPITIPYYSRDLLKCFYGPSHRFTHSGVTWKSAPFNPSEHLALSMLRNDEAPVGSPVFPSWSPSWEPSMGTLHGSSPGSSRRVYKPWTRLDLPRGSSLGERRVVFWRRRLYPVSKFALTDWCRCWAHYMKITNQIMPLKAA